jgi:hypothetical protein
LLRKLGRRAESSVSRNATGRKFKNSRAEFNARSSCHSASGHRDAARANRNSGRAAESELPRILFAKWNSEPNSAGIKFAGDSHPRDSNTAFDRQSQQSEHSRRFAQR